MRLWVDIANSPHVTLFHPVVEELRRTGHEVVLTVWDRGQTGALATRCWPDAVVVGEGFRRSRADKAMAVWGRAAALRDRLRGVPLDAAVGHNSYSQIVAARLLGIPVVTAMDYEHQPANHLAFRLADRILLPDAIPFGAVRAFGATAERVVRYPGPKESVALSTFRPDPDFLRTLGIDRGTPVVTVRPPAEGALYHRHPNRIFDALLPRLGALDARVLLTPRTGAQAERYRDVPGVDVLDQPVSGPDLLFHSDLVVGAGGTMTREAAVLGTPCVTVFSGRPAAVDLALIRAGRLRTAADLEAVLRGPIRRVQAREWKSDPEALRAFTAAVIAAAASIRPRRHRRVSGPRLHDRLRPVGPAHASTYER